MSPSYLKPACPCGHAKCKAFGEPVKATGHARNCWSGCPTCARGKSGKGTSRRIPTAVRRAITVRANGYCEARILEVCTGQPEHAHHVRRRSQGGGESPANLKLVCGECHQWIHDHPQEAAERGLLARTSSEPLSSAVTRVERIR